MNKSTTLLVIDMQLCAFDGQITPPIVGADTVLENTAKLIEGCRARDIAILFLQTKAISGQPYAKDMHGWEIHSRMGKLPSDTVVYKRNSSGFDDTNLHEVLSATGVEQLIMCGVWSEFCLANTVKSALDLNYQVCVAAQAHGTVAESEAKAEQVVQQQNLALAKAGAIVLETPALLQRFSL